ncbi:DUF2939 domain-containing protein [Chamaesiphon sp. VAR_48_metabat_403]|uniref:DUF2939 domain-containing protein n=1 Tax=Chamaesiphon sp. VAR_48_metabat_403 TaxID=2964700 RepID=UPI00286DC6DF|nr:DUF2939 domain-containing protein [Chamaesiphon sp. VAR_48_metabat_403]
MFDSLSERLRDRLKSTDKKTIITGAAVSAGLVAIVSGGAYYAPYLTLNNIKNATEHRNADALSQEINFPELRVSVKENIKAKILKQTAKDSTIRSPELTPSLVDKIVNPIVDELITPAGIEKLMLDKVPEAKIDLSYLETDLNKSNVTMGYESIDRFVIRIIDKVDRTKDVSLILKRDGFLAWKLSAIDISKV